ncbi:MAG: class I SAM-dependent methyltransferase [Betaproteobacteria bacterium]|nr:class I SAM-dependent methyltransferase [Betaproteobacteria bacterium]
MSSNLRAFLSRHPKIKQVARRVYARLFPDRSVSTSYESIQHEHVVEQTQRLRASWQSELIPARQRKLVDRQLEAYRTGKPIDVFDVLVAALSSLSTDNGPRTLLEVGCSSGFYSEVLNIKNLPYTYSGCDYSLALIDLGKRRYPNIPLSVQDATVLHFENASFDVVVSGGCLLHIPEFEKAIAETARVARESAIFHRTPVVNGLPTQYFRKQAYGVETMEIHFNEEELLALFSKYDLELIAVHTLTQDRDAKVPDAWRFNRTYVCRKKTNAA